MTQCLSLETPFYFSKCYRSLTCNFFKYIFWGGNGGFFVFQSYMHTWWVFRAVKSLRWQHHETNHNMMDHLCSSFQSPLIFEFVKKNFILKIWSMFLLVCSCLWIHCLHFPVQLWQYAFFQTPFVWVISWIIYNNDFELMHRQGKILPFYN